MADLWVVIADDPPPTRAAVRAALEADGFDVVAEVGDADRYLLEDQDLQTLGRSLRASPLRGESDGR